MLADLYGSGSSAIVVHVPENLPFLLCRGQSLIDRYSGHLLDFLRDTEFDAVETQIPY
jgi:hypothetical protein